MLRIGLTGGIGSGKTTVARVFETLGIPVYDADHAAKNLMNHDPALKASIIELFGEESYQHHKLNRSYIAGIVFNDPEKLAKLNALIHPVTIADAEKWLSAQQQAPYAIKEAALLFESGADKHLDYIIGVTAPEETRIKRVAARDHLDPEDVRKRIQNQMNEDEKMKRCHFVLHNDEKDLLLPQVLELHKVLMSKTGN